MAEIYDAETGDLLTAGLQGCSVCDEALIAATNLARDLNRDVHLSDDDGEWIVHPDGKIDTQQPNRMEEKR